MAIIKCQECGKDISDHAQTCPHCGYPIQLIKNQEIDEQNKKAYKDVNTLRLVFNIIAFGLSYTIGYNGFAPSSKPWGWLFLVICLPVFLFFCGKLVFWISLYRGLHRYHPIPRLVYIFSVSCGYLVGAIFALKPWVIS